MSNYSAQGSITIKRLRNGDSLFMSLELNGKPLYQSYDDQTGTVAPDWTVAANQPIITPHVSSTKSGAVTTSLHTWTYNGVQLVFNGATSGGYTTDSTGKFALNPVNGALKIIDNLASSVNTANDTLQYACVATVAGVEYNLSKSIDIQIQMGGASSYYGFVNASSLQLDESHDSVTLASELWLSAAAVNSYYIKWYKGNTEWAAKAGQKTITVTRADVDGSQLFIAEFYKAQGDTNYICRYGISVIDTLDEIILVPYIYSANKEVDTNNPVVVKARIVRASTNAVLTPSNPTWAFTIMDGDTWTVKGTSNTDSITVTTAHTDQQDGSTHDVEVLAEVSFDSLSS